MVSHFIVAGGAGFIGSHMVDYLLDKYPDAAVCCLDKLSYAADHSLQNLQAALANERFSFQKVDLALDPLDSIIARQFQQAKHVVVLNFAAESCVDRSFTDPVFFTQNNVLATQRLVEACVKARNQNLTGSNGDLDSTATDIPTAGSEFSFVHISTDEVYGEQMDEAVDETAALLPSNPYAASKAACDLLLHSYRRAYRVPVAILRANNIYGPRQNAEKIVARVLKTLAEIQQYGCQSEKVSRIPIHGTGQQRRRYLHVSDFVRAVDLVHEAMADGYYSEVYNVGSRDEMANLELVAKMFQMHQNGDESFLPHVEYVEDRLFNDSRYAISYDKIEDLGWSQRVSLDEGLSGLICSLRK